MFLPINPSINLVRGFQKETWKRARKYSERCFLRSQIRIFTVIKVFGLACTVDQSWHACIGISSPLAASVLVVEYIMNFGVLFLAQSSYLCVRPSLLSCRRRYLGKDSQGGSRYPQPASSYEVSFVECVWCLTGAGLGPPGLSQIGSKRNQYSNHSFFKTPGTKELQVELADSWYISCRSRYFPGDSLFSENIAMQAVPWATLCVMYSADVIGEK